jgi:hypothetical protein
LMGFSGKSGIRNEYGLIINLVEVMINPYIL